MADERKRILTGIRPTGALHLGHYAGALHNCFSRLGQIAAPTLIVHGRDDRVIPVGNADLMAEHIPDVRLRVLDECGHMFPTEHLDVDLRRERWRCRTLQSPAECAAPPLSSSRAFPVQRAFGHGVYRGFDVIGVGRVDGCCRTNADPW